MDTDIIKFRYVCPCCGKIKSGLPALTFTSPFRLPQQSLVRKLRLGRKANDIYIDEVTGNAYVRCVLSMPIVEMGGTLEWGVWAHPSRRDLQRYKKTFSSERQLRLGPMPAWFSSTPSSYPSTYGLRCLIVPRDGNLRPLIEMEPTDHPLARDQRNGIALARAVEFARPWLTLMHGAEGT